MSSITIGFAALFGFLFLSALGLPLGFSFALVGFIGMSILKGWMPALNLLGGNPYSQVASFVLCSVPLFTLMGQLAFYSGISRNLFNAAYKIMSRLPGGLALATMGACTAFAACTGSSVASAATMGTIAFPEMKRYKYSSRLAAGTIAAGGTLGILIPPSTIFIILGMITETSIGALFIAGILPGLLLAGTFGVLILIMCKRDPALGPPGKAFPWKERVRSLGGVWGMLVLFMVVIGGLYIGVFSPSEAGCIGAFGAFALALLKRMPYSSFLSAFRDSVQITSYILFILIGASIFNIFLGITGLPGQMSLWIANLPVPRLGIVIAMLVLYIPLGMFLDTLGMILLTVPIFFPVIVQLGFDPVWFGVLICMVAELGMITPPVAINVYVVQGVTKVPMEDIFLGVIPFGFVYIIIIGLMLVFPGFSLYLPNLMGG
ncbi:MAG: TRAP transporter large permease [Desulfobacteraceae bacterium]|nr:MAG: TRAP transporter large permease [Desulfobacteraceae bacterium]